jgi:hypothetical protein
LNFRSILFFHVFSPYLLLFSPGNLRSILPPYFALFLPSIFPRFCLFLWPGCCLRLGLIAEHHSAFEFCPLSDLEGGAAGIVWLADQNRSLAILWAFGFG